jgi:hypothetical protein
MRVPAKFGVEQSSKGQTGGVASVQLQSARNVNKKENVINLMFDKILVIIV